MSYNSESKLSFFILLRLLELESNWDVINVIPVIRNLSFSA